MGTRSEKENSRRDRNRKKSERRVLREVLRIKGKKKEPQKLEKRGVPEKKSSFSMIEKNESRARRSRKSLGTGVRKKGEKAGKETG